jgi:hypothetical protein
MVVYRLSCFWRRGGKDVGVLKQKVDIAIDWCSLLPGSALAGCVGGTRRGRWSGLIIVGFVMGGFGS